MHSSTFILLASNLIAIVIALALKWDIKELVWVYWSQSIIIGFYQGCRMMSLNKFTTKDMTMNDEPVPETPEAKLKVVVIFAMHYGIFHAAYLVFLLADTRPELTDIGWIGLWISIIAFAVNHHFSFVSNRERDRKRVPNLGKMMFFPYLRIIPMHLTIIFGFKSIQSGSSHIALLLFLVLKTVCDVAMHVIEHREKKG